MFLSSHLLAEVELAPAAAMMANGKLVAQDRVDALLAPTGRLRIESPDASEAAAFLRTRHMTVEWLDQHHLRVHLNGEPAEAVNSLLVGQGLRIRGSPGATDAGGRVPRAHGRRAVRAERGPAAVAAALAPRAAPRRGSPRAGAAGRGRGGRLVIGVELTKNTN